MRVPGCLSDDCRKIFVIVFSHLVEGLNVEVKGTFYISLPTHADDAIQAYLNLCTTTFTQIIFSTHLDENGHDQNGDEEEDELLQVPCAPQDPLIQSHHEH